MIKRYNEFVNGKVNEDFETIDPMIEEPITDTESEVEEAPVAELPEEEGGEYQGQMLLNQLANELGTEVSEDGSINYEGKKINFFSETEKFHVDNKKFSTAEEVVNYLGSAPMTSDEEDEMTGEREGERNVGLDEVEELEENPAFTTVEDDEDDWNNEDAFESKSYKHTRKFESFRKNK